MNQEMYVLIEKHFFFHQAMIEWYGFFQLFLKTVITYQSLCIFLILEHYPDFILLPPS